MNPEYVKILDEIDLTCGVAGFALGFEYGAWKVPLTELTMSGAMNYIKASAEESWVMNLFGDYDTEAGAERFKTLVAKFLKEAETAMDDVIEGDKPEDSGDPNDADI